MLAKLEMSDRRELAGWAPSHGGRFNGRRLALVAGLGSGVAVAAILAFLFFRPDESTGSERHIWWFETNSDALFTGLLIRDVLKDSVREVSADPGTVFAFPAWSPDGSRLAVTQFQSDAPYAGKLRLWAPPGQTIGDVPFSGPPAAPLYWAPDSKHLAVVSDEVVLVSAEGKSVASARGPGQISGVTQIIADGSFWSPDSQRFAFYRDGEVAVVGLDGSAQRLSLIEAGVDTDPKLVGLGRWTDSAHLEVGHRTSRTEVELFELSVSPTGIQLAKSAGVPALPTDIPPDPKADELQTRTPNMVYTGGALSVDGRGKAYVFNKPYPIPGEVRPASVVIVVGGREFPFETSREVRLDGAPQLRSAGFVVVGDWP